MKDKLKEAEHRDLGCRKSVVLERNRNQVPGIESSWKRNASRLNVSRREKNMRIKIILATRTNT